MANIMFPDHAKILARWNLDPRVETRVSNSRLHILAANISKDVKVDVNFLRFLCGTYNTENSAFCIGGKEIYLGLEDILYITGLPISGCVVAADCSDVKSDCRKYLGIQTTTLDLKLSYLLDNFQRVPIGTSEADLERYVRAYYLFVIGCVVVPEPSGTVPVEYVCMMKHTDKIDQYAWGSAMLTFLHSFFHRNDHRPVGSKIFYGSPLVLQIFALIRLPQLWRHYELPDPPQFPLVRVWVELLKRKSMDNNTSRIHYSPLVSDNVQVILKPYANIVGAPSFVTQQLPLSFGQMHLICLNMAWLYDSQCCREQVQRTICTNYKLAVVFRHKPRGTTSGENWIKHYKMDIILEWEKVHHMLSLQLESPFDDDDEEEEHEQSVGAAQKRGWRPAKMYTVQCGECMKWRLIPTRGKYEEIRERNDDQPFTCETAREWRPESSCEDESDVKQDGSLCWAMDKPSIPRTPSGWQRVERVNNSAAAEGGGGLIMSSDIYYVSPSNKRLHSMAELDRYLEEHPRYQKEGVNIDRFSFEPPELLETTSSDEPPLEAKHVAKRRAVSP